MSEIATTKGGFNIWAFLITVGAVILALFLFNMFTEQKMVSTSGETVGSTSTTAKMPGKNSRKSRGK